MLVEERMTKNPVTVTIGTGIDDALKLMHERRVRRLPVMDQHGKLVGIISEKDLLYASPSPATSLSIFELRYLLAKIKVEQIMHKPVVTVTENMPLEEAARIMADKKIGGLPVMRGEQMVGIITETDIFKIFVELLGARQPGVRLTLLAPNVKGQLARVTTTIASLGGNIIALGTAQGDGPGRALLTIKVDGVAQNILETAMKELGLEIVDARAS